MNAARHEHERAAELLPWLVNGTLRGAELAWLHAHLDACQQCRAEQQHQQRVRDAVARQPVVELAPQASFKRLWERIETQSSLPEGASANAGALDDMPVAPTPRARHWQRGRVYAVAASLAAAAGIVTLMFLQSATPDAGNRYRTVSSAALTAEQTQIRVVFAESATVGDIKNILAGAHLEATSGPTPAGVFTLQPAAELTGAGLEAVVRALRNDPRVRFAELR